MKPNEIACTVTSTMFKDVARANYAFVADEKHAVKEQCTYSLEVTVWKNGRFRVQWLSVLNPHTHPKEGRCKPTGSFKSTKAGYGNYY